MQSVHTLLKLAQLRWTGHVTSLKDIPTESREQAARGRTKWRCLIKGAAQFEAKRICEAERKCKEQKARDNGLSSDSAQSELTCSICKNWLKQPTYNHT